MIARATALLDNPPAPARKREYRAAQVSQRAAPPQPLPIAMERGFCRACGVAHGVQSAQTISSSLPQWGGGRGVGPIPYCPVRCSIGTNL